MIETYHLTDWACCEHCAHDTDGGPPHEDPCPEDGCTDGQKGTKRTVRAQARDTGLYTVMGRVLAS